MSVVIKCICRAAGETPREELGAYLREYRPHEGKYGAIVWTHDLARAHHYPSMFEAMAAYRTVNKTEPMRPDGRPNRPLTAFTIELVKVDDKGSAA
jgi:hypothetical protein